MDNLETVLKEFKFDSKIIEFKWFKNNNLAVQFQNFLIIYDSAFNEIFQQV